jgi:hypothetical protein
MRPPLPSPLRGWRAALLLVAVVCLSPERAAAGCGDHVTILNDSAKPDQHATPGTSEVPANPARPCEGPNCSGVPNRHVPPLAPVTPVGPQAKEVVQCLGAVGADDDPRGAFDRDPASPRPVRRPSSVFHPPRVG